LELQFFLLLKKYHIGLIANFQLYLLFFIKILNFIPLFFCQNSFFHFVIYFHHRIQPITSNLLRHLNWLNQSLSLYLFLQFPFLPLKVILYLLVFIFISFSFFSLQQIPYHLQELLTILGQCLSGQFLAYPSSASPSNLLLNKFHLLFFGP
jgi:hypothetical protein